MRVKRGTSIRFEITVFDDNKKWVHVDKCETGREARTVYQSRAADKISAEDLKAALNVVASLAAIEMMDELRRQELLF